jgi:hypothetical protein
LNPKGPKHCHKSYGKRLQGRAEGRKEASEHGNRPKAGVRKSQREERRTKREGALGMMDSQVLRAESLGNKEESYQKKT